MRNVRKEPFSNGGNPSQGQAVLQHTMQGSSLKRDAAATATIEKNDELDGIRTRNLSVSTSDLLLRAECSNH